MKKIWLIRNVFPNLTNAPVIGIKQAQTSLVTPSLRFSFCYIYFYKRFFPLKKHLYSNFLQYLLQNFFII